MSVSKVDDNNNNNNKMTDVLDQLSLLPYLLNPHISIPVNDNNSNGSSLVDKLRLADIHLSEQRKQMKSQISLDAEEEVSSVRILMTDVSCLLKTLEENLDAINSSHFQISYGNMRHQLGLLKSDISNELRERLLSALQLLLLLSTQPVVKKMKMHCEELTRIEGFIGSLSVESELSVDDLDVLLLSLTDTFKKINAELN